jgi:hypothetical protein
MAAHSLSVQYDHLTSTIKPHQRPDQLPDIVGLKEAVTPYAGQEIHVVLDNLSTHTIRDIQQWLAAHPNVRFHSLRRGPRG